MAVFTPEFQAKAAAPNPQHKQTLNFVQFSDFNY